MNTWIKILTIIVIIETLMIFIYLCGLMEIDTNSASVLIGSLSVIVTFVVGWNIYQVIDTKEIVKEVPLLQSNFNSLRKEIDTLHEVHEAYVLSMDAEDLRRRGYSSLAFEQHMQSAFIFAKDLQHYELRFMQALSLMRVSYDDMFRSAMESRDNEIKQFVNKKEDYINQLENLLSLINNLSRFSEQAKHDIKGLINDLRKLRYISPGERFEENEE
ncbi:MAG: hypothetical protein K2N48_01560 [Muribaculaceae bacterium]|nr:hypothetical protein [Muribaculaceae bacterium]